MNLSAAVIYLVACHGAPADHFATFAEKLTKDGYEVRIYASGPALKKFQDRNIDVAMSFNPDNLSKSEEAELASQIARSCYVESVVVTDVGHRFNIALQKALATESPQVVQLAYYDNPEPCVPGTGPTAYSNVADEIMLASKGVIFANANLVNETLYREINVPINLPFTNRVGLGYYPVAQANKVAEKRTESHETMRAQFLSNHGIQENGQKVLVYFGGNNEEYFTEAFPAFLRFLSEGMKNADLSNIVIVMQQHPGAKNKNIDREQIEAWKKANGQITTAPKIIVSEATTDEMQVVADGALYYQTSMGPALVLAGIPVVQVGHKTYEDILVRGKLCPSVTDSSAFVNAITAVKPITISKEQRAAIFKDLGIKEDWYNVLKEALTNK